MSDTETQIDAAAEFDKAVSGAQTSAATPAPSQATPEPSAAPDTQAQLPLSEPPASEAAQEPAKPAAPKPQPSTPAATTTEATASADPWATAPEPLRKQWADAQAALAAAQADVAKQTEIAKRAAGKLRQTQDELNSIKRGQPRPTQQHPASPPATTQQTPATAVTSAWDSPGWKELEREYPEEAKRQRETIEARVAFTERAANEKIDALERKVSDLTERLTNEIAPVISEQRTSREIGELEKVHPDWQEIDKNPEFDAWFNELPEKVQESIDFRKAGDVIWLLNQYKRDAAAADAATATPETPAAVAPAATVSTVAARREQTLRSAVTPKVTGTPIARAHAENLTPAQQFDLAAFGKAS